MKLKNINLLPVVSFGSRGTASVNSVGSREAHRVLLNTTEIFRKLIRPFPCCLGMERNGEGGGAVNLSSKVKQQQQTAISFPLLEKLILKMKNAFVSSMTFDIPSRIEKIVL